MLLRDVASGQTLHTWEHNSPIATVAFSPDGRHMLSGAWDGTVTAYDTDSGDPLQSWEYDAEVRALTFSPDGRQILIGTGNNVVLREAAIAHPEVTPRQVPAKSSEKQNSAPKIRPKKVEIAVKLLYLQCGIAVFLAFTHPEWLWGQELLWGMVLVWGIVADQYRIGKGFQGHGLLYYVLLLPRFVWSLFSVVVIGLVLFVMPVAILDKFMDGSLSSRTLIECLDPLALLPGVIAWALWESERK